MTEVDEKEVRTSQTIEENRNMPMVKQAIPERREESYSRKPRGNADEAKMSPENVEDKKDDEGQATSTTSTKKQKLDHQPAGVESAREMIAEQMKRSIEAAKEAGSTKKMRMEPKR